MVTLGTNLKDTLTPITKKKFKRWHSEGGLSFLTAGNGNLDITLSRLNDHQVDWYKDAKFTGSYDVDGRENNIYMFANGVHAFILVIDDMTGSNNSYEYHKRTGYNHMTIYIVKETK